MQVNATLFRVAFILKKEKGVAMAKAEKNTDLWVYDLLKEANIDLEAQGSSIKEIDDALKSASKKGTGKSGKPEYVGVIKDFVIVVEDKNDIKKHEAKMGETLSIATEDVVGYALNGALSYAFRIKR